MNQPTVGDRVKANLTPADCLTDSWLASSSFLFPSSHLFLSHPLFFSLSIPAFPLPAHSPSSRSLIASNRLTPTPPSSTHTPLHTFTAASRVLCLNLAFPPPRINFAVLLLPVPRPLLPLPPGRPSSPSLLHHLVSIIPSPASPSPSPSPAAPRPEPPGTTP